MYLGTRFTFPLAIAKSSEPRLPHANVTLLPQTCRPTDKPDRFTNMQGGTRDPSVPGPNQPNSWNSCQPDSAQSTPTGLYIGLMAQCDTDIPAWYMVEFPLRVGFLTHTDRDSVARYIFLPNTSTHTMDGLLRPHIVFRHIPMTACLMS